VPHLIFIKFSCSFGRLKGIEKGMDPSASALLPKIEQKKI
jgi:hypothetical protein